MSDSLKNVANSGSASILPAIGLGTTQAGRRDARAPRGFTLIELVITMTILAILSIGVIPLLKTAVKRQREQQLRESLRQMRESIKDFKRDTVGAPCCGQLAVAGGGGGGGGGGGAPPPVPTDPRSKIMISDRTIFTPDNLDFYPPDLETLVKGVSVVSRAQPVLPGVDRQPLDGGDATSSIKKTYLRKIPVDPITGKEDWCYISSFNPDSCDGQPNVFDVRSRSDETALNGEKYSDW